MGRLARIDVADRRECVRDMILKACTSNHIKQFIMQKYSVGLSTVEHDLTIVYSELREFAQKIKEQTIEMHLNRYEQIYKQCMDDGNQFVAMKALKQKEELLQLHKQAPLVAIQQNNMNFDNLTFEEIQKLLDGINNKSENNTKAIT